MGNVQTALNQLQRHQVLLLTDCNYNPANMQYNTSQTGARMAKLLEGSYLLSNLEAASIPSDAINYIALGARTAVTLYENDRFSGRAVTLTNSTDGIQHFTCARLRELGMAGVVSSLSVVALRY